MRNKMDKEEVLEQSEEDGIIDLPEDEERGNPTVKSSEEDEQYEEYKRSKRVEEAKRESLKIEYDLTQSFLDKPLLKETCRMANAVKIGALIVYPAFVRNAVSFLGRDPQVSLIAAISATHGEDLTAVKCKAVKLAVRDGVDEVEVYAPVSKIKDGGWMYFKRECRKLKRAAKSRAVRLVIDCERLNEKELIKACVSASDCRIDCLRLKNAEAYTISRVKEEPKVKCLVKAEGVTTRAQFMNMCAMGADYVACEKPFELADELLTVAKK